MAAIYEDFIRCECGGADFKEETIVTLPKGLRKRGMDEQHIQHPTLEKQVNYVCIACNKKMDL